jgi:hypothetical protein
MKRMDVRFAARRRHVRELFHRIFYLRNEAKNHMQWHPVSDIISCYDNRE